jgi:hypothetical protein
MLNPGIQMVEHVSHSALPVWRHPIQEMLTGAGRGWLCFDKSDLLPAGPGGKFSNE